MGGGGSSKPEWDLTGMLISCDECRMQGTDACGDCVVTYLLDRPDGAVVFDADEERAIRALNKAGLLPEVRWEERAAAAEPARDPRAQGGFAATRPALFFGAACHPRRASG